MKQKPHTGAQQIGAHAPRHRGEEYKQTLKNFLLHLPKVKVLVILALIILFLLAKHTMILALFIAANALVSCIIRLLGMRSLGLETITLTSIVTLYALGLWPAMLLMLIGIGLHIIVAQGFSINNFLMLPVGALLIVLAGVLQPLGIVSVGILVTVVQELLFTCLVVFLKTGRLHKRLFFFATHVLFNVVLFTVFANPLLALF